MAPYPRNTARGHDTEGLGACLVLQLVIPSWGLSAHICEMGEVSLKDP